MLKKGSTGEEVRKLQSFLSTSGFLTSAIDGIFGGDTEEAVVKFQKSKKLIKDGIVGSSTAFEINTEIEKLGLVKLSVPQSQKIVESSKKLRWIKCPADVFPGRGGYSSLTLRADTAKAYKELYDDVSSLGGIVTTAGGKRSLRSKSSPSRSRKSMHYVGLAFDLALPTGMQNPNTDPYVITKRGTRGWEVWCRTEDSSVGVITLEGYKAQSKYGKTKLTTVQVTGRFFSFTELANNHGFKPINGRRSFFRGGSYTGAEWWHFQYEKALTEKSSTFGEEILKVYDLQTAKKFIYWEESKNCTFKVDWF